ncbi:transcriptional regulator, GntR family [Rathayibacter oskolensis]|uniref:Transcriptional regulator, GntR family n=1 Tax=Rathayibacter oskolensis TaxID=1891671 RepID=A0A1X7PCI6_9MICO|nr:GntR family transcriptional regulator [Rathayibacter oskolensis]SMH49014.1 transcriptional regulator, GntR family [Rathayibacter oskolensis]
MENTAIPVDPGLALREASGRAPVGDSVYQELLARVLSAELGAGDRITIDALVREMGVSQTPIREALHRLAADGIVVRNHHAGYRVAPELSREQFEELIVIRQLLEPAAARGAAHILTVDELDELAGIATRMSTLLTEAGRGYAEFSRLDAEFHDVIARSCGNRFIHDSLARLHTHAHLFRLSKDSLITSLALDEHAAILDALRLRDAGEASFAMRRHIDASADRFRGSFTDSAR